jgi:rubredoxin
MEENRFCPNCGSTNVEPDFSNSGFVGEAGGNPNSWECNSCSYTGIMPAGDPEEKSSSGEEIEFEPGVKYSREDVSLGRGYLKYVLYILLPLIVLYALARFTG